MNRGAARIVCLALIACIVFVSSLISVGLTDSDYYPLAIGNSWTYKTTDLGSLFQGRALPPGKAKMEVNATRNVAGSECYVMQRSIEGILLAERCMGWEGQRLITYQEIDGRDEELAPPRIELDTPLTVGHSWNWTGSILGPGKEGWERTTDSITYVVSNQSSVQVPAGTYEAYPVEARETFGGHTSRTQLWYAQGIGLVKEVDFAGTPDEYSFELTSYSIAPQQSSWISGGGIPGFPFESLFGGLLAGVAVLIIIRYRREHTRISGKI